jgi:hypothetical protein
VVGEKEKIFIYFTREGDWTGKKKKFPTISKEKKVGRGKRC